MQKSVRLFNAVVFLAGLAIAISSCKDSEEPPEIPATVVSFSASTLTVAEGETEVKATLVLDHPAPENVLVDYQITGTATPKLASSVNPDFEFVDTPGPGQIVIAKGETSVDVVMNIFEDRIEEPDNETIILEIVAVSSAQFEIGTADKITITIDDEPILSGVSFDVTEMNVVEGEFGVIAYIELDEAVPYDIIVSYDISGTADEGDFEIVGTAGEIEIPSGETSVEIELNILPDETLEDHETIILQIVDVSGGPVEIGTDHQLTMTILRDNVKASFVNSTLTVNESNSGFHEITVQLEASAPFDVAVLYELNAWADEDEEFIPGMAIDSLAAYFADVSNEYWDYYIADIPGVLTIPAGELTATIRLSVYSDFMIEDDETIELTIQDSEGVVPGLENKIAITVKQENGKIIALSWPDNTDVDMDMFVWLITEDDTVAVTQGLAISTQSPEARIIPEVISQQFMDEHNVSSLKYGASYVYYEGSEDPLEFQVDFVDLVNGTSIFIETSYASYTLENINTWDFGPPPIVVQTFDYFNGDLINITDITVPASGSRVRPGPPRTAPISPQISIPVQRTFRY